MRAGRGGAGQDKFGLLHTRECYVIYIYIYIYTRTLCMNTCCYIFACSCFWHRTVSVLTHHDTARSSVAAVRRCTSAKAIMVSALADAKKTSDPRRS